MCEYCRYTDYIIVPINDEWHIGISGAKYKIDKYDRYHNENGPAYEGSSGNKQWYVNGQHIDCSTQEEFECLMRLELFW